MWFLGIGSRPAKIRARKILNAREKAEEFLERVFDAMQISVNVNIVENMDEKVMNIDLSGDDMGVLIGKRGQTLDSLQYLVSLVVNKDGEEYVRVKVDTENYRQRRKDTLENLAKNISFKVKRTGRTVTLEPMNPYERRVIHSALQNDKFVETHSEGEEPFRRVVVALKEGVKVRENNNNHRRRYSNNRNYNRNHSKKGGGRE
ncbi:MAG: protein jag [Lachnospiraceae bacterium]|nr:protein jag [Lachnospiraceae bacterium]